MAGEEFEWLPPPYHKIPEVDRPDQGLLVLSLVVNG